MFQLCKDFIFRTVQVIAILSIISIVCIALTAWISLTVKLGGWVIGF